MGAGTEGPADLVAEAAFLGEKQESLEIFRQTLVVGRTTEDVAVVSFQILFRLDFRNLLQFNSSAAQSNPLGDVLGHFAGHASSAEVCNEYLFHVYPP